MPIGVLSSYNYAHSYKIMFKIFIKTAKRGVPTHLALPLDVFT